MVQALKCDSLVSSAYLAPNEIRGCCDSINGKLRGLQLLKLKVNDISFENNKSKKVLAEINSSDFSKNILVTDALG